MLSVVAAIASAIFVMCMTLATGAIFDLMAGLGDPPNEQCADVLKLLEKVCVA
jgi:hypothetical protein